MSSKRIVTSLSRSTRGHSAPWTAPFYRSIRSKQQSRHLSTQSLPVFLSSKSTRTPMPLRQPKRHFTTTLVARKDEPPSSSTPPQSTLYTFTDIQSLSSQPCPNRILIDVREPSELRTTGKIPSAQNLPITSAADGFFLPAEEFEERFGFEKPGKEDEVIFYCKAGVRSRAAARLAGQAGFAGKIGEFPGSWIEWAEKGGEVEKVK
ncbi:Thiosulfate sulfurtransferase rdl2, mitochondrial [Cladophialophora chaetospira]|uniref:Thiosulfate sulfurtransferase rdl2, mitochondrial n=1 Tax=Cladophialophora chaetospira TaxID=386627 RepID=A0AA38XIS7_9EURO|nr:Thiosulfate sulfurtransferase rdl2, mitochondrial [Cladophialophora chaetospira]